MLEPCEPSGKKKAVWLQKKLANELKKQEWKDQVKADADAAAAVAEQAKADNMRRERQEEAAKLRGVPDTTANYRQLEGKIEVEEDEMPGFPDHIEMSCYVRIRWSRLSIVPLLKSIFVVHSVGQNTQFVLMTTAIVSASE